MCGRFSVNKTDQELEAFVDGDLPKGYARREVFPTQPVLAVTPEGGNYPELEPAGGVAEGPEENGSKLVLMTTAPNWSAESIHARMPMIIAPEDKEGWLTSSLRAPLEAMMNRKELTGCGKCITREIAKCLQPGGDNLTVSNVV